VDQRRAWQMTGTLYNGGAVKRQSMRSSGILRARCGRPVCQKIRRTKLESRVLVTRRTGVPFSRSEQLLEQFVCPVSARRTSQPATGTSVNHLHSWYQWMVSGRINTHNFQIRYWYPSIEFDCLGTVLSHRRLGLLPWWMKATLLTLARCCCNQPLFSLACTVKMVR
jgi:hypothetical protein